jgi:hypothetical protein
MHLKEMKMTNRYSKCDPVAEYEYEDRLDALDNPVVPWAKNLTDLRPEFVELVEALIPEIGDEDRIGGDEDDVPCMELTIACNNNGDQWNYQTGDNSYTGGAYSLPHWAVLYLSRDSDPVEVANEAIDQLLDLVAYCHD